MGAGPGLSAGFPYLLDPTHALGLLGLPTSGRLVAHPLPLLQATKPATLYAGVVDEKVLASLVGGDEAVALLLVELLHRAPGHTLSPFLASPSHRPPTGPTAPPPSAAVGPRWDMVANFSWVVRGFRRVG